MCKSLRWIYLHRSKPEYLTATRTIKTTGMTLVVMLNSQRTDAMRILKTLPIDPSKNSRIAIVGEAPGETEIRKGQPFVGQSGEELTRMLSEAGIVRNECMLTNVFMERPPGNNIYAWCLKKKEADNEWQRLGNKGKYPFAGLKSGAYMRPARLGEISRLYAELLEYDPHVIVALGNTPLWALSGEGGITKSRGTIVECDLGGERSFKVLPTFHPSYILRQWEHRPIVVADLMKVKRESVRPDYTRPRRTLWLEPTHEDIETFAQNFLQPADRISVDIETGMGQITCIGFGTRTHVICIPFVDTRKKGWSYWESAEAEVKAWELVRGILNLPNTKLFQNGMYDMQWLWKQMGLKVSGSIDDTMLMAHSMFPEMQKSLGFLGSIYTNEASWKKMRPKKRTTQKRGDTEE